MVQIIVEQLGYESVGAVDGAEAWDLFRQVRPEIVLADRALPRMGGVELFGRIRAHPAGALAYLLLVGVPDRACWPSLSADGCLTLPVSARDLRRRLVVGSRRHRPEVRVG